MLHINDLTYRIGDRLLFERATLAVARGQKIGLVGPNGSGKTTLFRLIAGEAHAESGSVAIPARVRLGRVAQEAPSGPVSLIETVLAADGERARLLVAAESERDPHRIADIHARLSEIGAHAAPARAAAILAGLGFDETAQQRPCAQFSGGWRMRVALAAALFAEPDLLLLDEPTNHLDLEATIWLEGHLAAWSGTLLLISHDRGLLNRAVAEIVHLDGGKLIRYRGGYDNFERIRSERIEHDGKLRVRQMEERRRIMAFVDRFRAKASKARQAQSRLKLLERMEPIAAVVEARATAFAFPPPRSLAPPLIDLDAVDAGYTPGQPVLSNLSFSIGTDDRIALLGANGNGKSTLMRLLAGRMAPLAGEARRAARLGVGYFAQHQMEELSPDETARARLARAMPSKPEPVVRAHLARFGLGAAAADLAIAKLSGGEKARLLFALMTTEAPQILLLDEPTNHLDVDAREALVQALNDFEGAVILVSHDPHLIEVVADRLWLVANGTCRPFDGDLDDYRRHVASERRQRSRGDGGSAGENGAPSLDRREERRRRAESRAAAKPLRDALRAAERKLEDLNRDKATIEARLADPLLYQSAPGDAAQLNIRLAEVSRATAEAETAWLAAAAALEESD